MEAAIFRVRKTGRTIEGKDLYEAIDKGGGSSGFVFLLKKKASRATIGKAAERATAKNWPSLIAIVITIE